MILFWFIILFVLLSRGQWRSAMSCPGLNWGTCLLVDCLRKTTLCRLDLQAACRYTRINTHLHCLKACIVLFTWVRHGVISQGVQLGETATNTANINIRHATRIRAKDGCNIPDACQSNLCPSHSSCTDNWASHTCVCKPGNTNSAIERLYSGVQKLKTTFKFKWHVL